MYIFLKKETIQDQIQQIHDLPVHSRTLFLKCMRDFATLKNDLAVYFTEVLL